METGKGLTVTEEDLAAFFSDVPKSGNSGPYELTEFQKRATIEAYEKKYHKVRTAKKLGINVKKMQEYYYEYKAGKK